MMFVSCYFVPIEARYSVPSQIVILIVLLVILRGTQQVEDTSEPSSNVRAVSVL